MIAITSVQAMANGYPRYVFPPLENNDGTWIENKAYYPKNNRQHYQQAYTPKQNSSHSFFRQPKYVFPEQERSQQTQTGSKYTFPIEESKKGNRNSYSNQTISAENYQSKGDNTFSRSEQDFRDNKNYSSYDDTWYGNKSSGINHYRSNNYRNDSWADNFDMFDGLPSPVASSFPTSPFFSDNSFMSPNYGNSGYGSGYKDYGYNNSAYRSRGYENNGFGNNNWNPFSSSQSRWPSSSNRSYDSNSSYTNPGIRIPGFFSR
jgi:hypothetical protein